MDIQRAILIFKKDFKNFEELKELDGYLSQLVEDDSAFHRLSNAHRYQVISKLELLQYNDNQIIFNKGDSSDCLYIILSGSLQMFTYSPNGFKVLEKIIYKGAIGERGILKNKHRSLCAHAIGITYLLRLDAMTFKKYLLGEFAANNLAKRAIVEKYIPCITQFSDTQKEKLSYAIRFQAFPKGRLLLKIGQVSEFMMIILEGECAMLSDQGLNKKVVSILDNGAIIGEDSAFFERGSFYNIVVTSDKVKVAILKNSDMRILFPSSVVNLMRNLIIQRNSTRNKLATFANPCRLKKTSFSFRNSGHSSTIISPIYAETNRIKEKITLKNYSFSSLLNN